MKLVMTHYIWHMKLLITKCTHMTHICFFSPSAETVLLLMSMQVDRVDRQRIFWSGNYLNPNSIEYQTLEGEASYAVSGSSRFARS